MNSKPLLLSSVSDPLISIVIPTYKRSEYLMDSVNSVLKQNNEDGVIYEIIVVNNDPEANMADFIDKYKFVNNLSVYINETNLGQVGNINRGIKLAKGRFVSLLHDDDVLLPNYLDSVSNYLKNPLYDCLITSNYLIDKQFRTDLKHKFLSSLFFIRFFYKKNFTEATLTKNAKSLRNIYGYPTCGMIFIKESIEQFGYFKDEHGAAWDYYNFRLFNKEFRMGVLHDFVAVRRIYTGMSNLDAIQKEFYEENLCFVAENKQHFFVRTFGKAMYDKKPFFKYFFAKLISSIYFYLHNLVTEKSISRKMFAEFKKDGYLI